MSFRKPVTKREFAREVFVGVTALTCLFAIFLFVAIQKSTGRSLSPLAYLWPETFRKQDERIPVVVFRSDEERHLALMEIPVPNPYRNQAEAKTETGDHQHRASPENKPDTRIVTKSNPAKDPDSNSKHFPVAQAGFSQQAKKTNDSQFESPNQGVSSQKASSGSPPIDIFNKSPDRTKEFSPPVSNQNVSLNPVNKSDQKVAPANFMEQKKSRPEPAKSNVAPEKTKAKQSKEVSEAIRNSLRIQPETDDSFWQISAKHYGDGKYFRLLAAFNNRSESSDNVPNPVLVPPLKDLLEIATRLEEKAAKSKVPTPEKGYRTSGGETLFEIAREQLGTASRYVEIYKLNKNRLPDNCNAQTQLKAGIDLSMPGQ